MNVHVAIRAIESMITYAKILFARIRLIKRGHVETQMNRDLIDVAHIIALVCFSISCIITFYLIPLLPFPLSLAKRQAFAQLLFVHMPMVDAPESDGNVPNGCYSFTHMCVHTIQRSFQCHRQACACFKIVISIVATDRCSNFPIQ